MVKPRLRISLFAISEAMVAHALTEESHPGLAPGRGPIHLRLDDQHPIASFRLHFRCSELL